MQKNGWKKRMIGAVKFIKNDREYARQWRCAILGRKCRANPSEHFLFDFDLESMLKDNVYVVSGNCKKYIKKWWKGNKRHWSVNELEIIS